MYDLSMPSTAQQTLLELLTPVRPKEQGGKRRFDSQIMNLLSLAFNIERFVEPALLKDPVNFQALIYALRCAEAHIPGGDFILVELINEARRSRKAPYRLLLSREDIRTLHCHVVKVPSPCVAYSQDDLRQQECLASFIWIQE